MPNLMAPHKYFRIPLHRSVKEFGAGLATAIDRSRYVACQHSGAARFAKSDSKTIQKLNFKASWICRGLKTARGDPYSGFGDPSRNVDGAAGQPKAVGLDGQKSDAP